MKYLFATFHHLRTGFLALLGTAGLVVWAGGCAWTESSLDDVGEQFQDGLQGRGRIVPNDPTADSFGPMYQ